MLGHSVIRTPFGFYLLSMFCPQFLTVEKCSFDCQFLFFLKNMTKYLKYVMAKIHNLIQRYSYCSIPVTDVLSDLGLLVNDVVGARDGIGGGFFSVAPST
jgi:hypothetical protein